MSLNTCKFVKMLSKISVGGGLRLFNVGNILGKKRIKLHIVLHVPASLNYFSFPRALISFKKISIKMVY